MSTAAVPALTHLSGIASPSAFPVTLVVVSGLEFNVVYEDAGDGWVYAHVPELPEVHTQGETLDQAREMVRDAIELVLAERRERGEEIPKMGWARVEHLQIRA